jgi:hypothetical protein
VFLPSLSSFSWSTVVGGLRTDLLYFLPTAHELLTKRCDADDDKGIRPLSSYFNDPPNWLGLYANSHGTTGLRRNRMIKCCARRYKGGSRKRIIRFIGVPKLADSVLIVENRTCLPTAPHIISDCPEFRAIFVPITTIHRASFGGRSVPIMTIPK